ncbi:hypothetical protein FRB91_001249 [Serendipita sp. 411]|nr:hypothetical protein FRB91_001249 [Serendipita sp. 411]
MNIQAIFCGVKTESLSELTLVESVTKVFDAMLAFAWYQFWTKGGTDILIHLLELVPSSNIGEESALRYTAEVHVCLGRMYCRLGRYQKACECLWNARNNFIKLGTPTDRIRAGESALYVADTYIYLQADGMDIFSLVSQAQKELKDDPKGSARALLYLGAYYWYEKMTDKALETLECARESLDKLGCTVDVMACRTYITRCYARQGKLEEWSKAGKELLHLSMWVGVDDWMANALLRHSRCSIRMEKYDDALVMLRSSIFLFNGIGLPLEAVEGLELAGYAYAKKGDLLGAKIAYKTAKKQYDDLKETSQTKEGSHNCEENLRKIEEGDMELNVPILN